MRRAGRACVKAKVERRCTSVGIAYWKIIINMTVKVNGDKDFGNTCLITFSSPRYSFHSLCLNLSSCFAFAIGTLSWREPSVCLCVRIHSWLPAFPSLGKLVVW